MKKKLLIVSLLLLASVFFILSFRFFDFFKFYVNPLLPFTNYLLGTEKPTTYLVLLGNDTESRANGGFAGSYAKITLSPGNDSSKKHLLCYVKSEICNLKYDFSFHDIYVPNGQLSGYVKPPEPIQQAFGLGSWYLANADFDPHFPTAATSIRWFLEKGKEINPDNLILLNLTTIKNILNILGEVNLGQNDTTITPDNLYLFLQGKAETNFFPGSTQKADALHLVGTAVIKKATSLPLNKKYQIAKIIFEDLKNQNIVVNSNNPDFQAYLVNQKYAGEYLSPPTHDYFGLVELNLGANKANSYIQRNTHHTITTENGKTRHDLKVTFHNSSPESNPNPPLHYGGNYIAYLRLHIPSNAEVTEINHTEIATQSSSINKEILENQTPQITNSLVSFWHITPAGSQSEINLTYYLPIIDQESYTLTVLKQNGFRTSPQSFNIFGEELQTPLFSTFTYPPTKK